MKMMTEYIESRMNMQKNAHQVDGNVKTYRLLLETVMANIIVFNFRYKEGLNFGSFSSGVSHLVLGLLH
jgi:hypothetical protein